MELARVGGGSYEAGLAALGLSGGLGPLGPFPSNPRTGGQDSGNRSQGPGGSDRGGGGGTSGGNTGGQMPSP